MRLTTAELWNFLRHNGNHFFRITFERRTTRPDGTAIAGSERTMICRTSMNAYKQGIIPDALRDEEDFRCGVLTVWSVDQFHRLIRQGMSRELVPWRCWRTVEPE